MKIYKIIFSLLFLITLLSSGCSPTGKIQEEQKIESAPSSLQNETGKTHDKQKKKPSPSFLQIELNGFFLDQYTSVPDKKYGKPYHTKVISGLIYNFYEVNGSTYIVFGEDQKGDVWIKTIQITGGPYDEMYPFMGLRLGDDLEKIKEILGEPTSSIYIEDVDYHQINFGDSNFSLEIDRNKKLVSIRIHKNYMQMRASKLINFWSEFKEAVTNKDLESLLYMIRPDAEIYLGSDTFSIDQPLRDMVYGDDSLFKKYLISLVDSVAAEITKYEPEKFIRKFDSGESAVVYKFEESDFLDEIVFFPHYGKWKLYEIQLRGGTAADKTLAMR